MTKQMIALMTVGLLLVLAVVLYINRVAVQATGLRVVERSEEIAAAQKLDNWEVFFRQASRDLQELIEARQRNVRQLRIDAAMAGRRIERDSELLGRYNSVVGSFVEQIKQSDGESFTAFGRTYTPERATEQLRVYVAEVMRKENDLERLRREKAAREKAAQEMETALQVARTKHRDLMEQGNRMIEQRDLQNIRQMGLEMNRALHGDASGELASAIGRMNNLFASLQSEIDASVVRGDLAERGFSSEAPLASLDEALMQIEVSGQDSEIDARIAELLR